MKNIVIGILFSLGCQLCKGQTDGIRNKVDSLSRLARVKADAVLSSLDTLRANSLLYSISNENYLIIHKAAGRYQQLYIRTDSAGRIKTRRSIRLSDRYPGLLRKAFDLQQYKTGFVTAVPHPDVVQGELSYFVIKDQNEKRYGEFYLAVLTKPNPLPADIYNYLFSTLVRESAK